MEYLDLFGDPMPGETGEERNRGDGVLSEFWDDLHQSGAVMPDTAYNYYLTARTLARHLRKVRYALPCPVNEVVLSNVTFQELSAITQREWDDYISYYRYVAHEKNGSMAVRISVMCRLYRWIESRTGVEPPAFIIGMERPAHTAKSFTIVTPALEKQLYERLRGPMVKRNASMISCFLHCGVGLDEISELEMSDLELSRLRVRSGDGSFRHVLLPEGTRHLIDEYLPVRLPPLDGGNWLFVSITGGKIKRGAIQKMFRNATNGLPITIRDMQLTFLTQLPSDQDREKWLASCRQNSYWYMRAQYGRYANTAESRSM